MARASAPVESAAPVRRAQASAPTVAAEPDAAPVAEAELTGPLAYDAVVAADGEGGEASATSSLNAAPAVESQTATPAPRIVVEPLS